MRRLVIVGGGISGLAAAWAARQAAARVNGGLEVLVLEQGADVGGKARTMQRDGWLVEGGPAGFLGGRPEMDRLVTGAGMATETVPASESAARRFVYRAGRMRRVVPNPVGLLKSGLLSPAGVGRLLLEPFVPRRRDGADETVWEFAARRIGAQAADRLVSPMALGIFAGDARRLSLGSAFPRMAALEREHGSLIRGLIARRGRMGTGHLTSFRNGMQSLPRALAQRGGFAVRCHARVSGIRRTDYGWCVAVERDRETIPADAVILAGEPWAMASLLHAVDAGAAKQLDAISCPAVTVVAFGYGPDVSANVPQGFGVLISRNEGLRMLGNLWESSIFPGRAPDGHVLIRAMFGGAVDGDAGTMSEPDVIALARAEVQRLYGIATEPALVECVRVPRAIPQYEVGHRDRVATVERALARLPGLFVTGFGLRGVSFADAASDGVRSGERAALELLQRASELPADGYSGTLGHSRERGEPAAHGESR